MPIIAQKAELTLPDKSEYIATILSDRPKWDVFKNKYDCDPIFKKLYIKLTQKAPQIHL